MFIPRLISGIVLVLIALVTVNMGGLVLWCVNLFLSLVGMMEMYRALNVHKKPISIVGYALTCFYYCFLLTDMSVYVMLGMAVLAFLVLMTFYVVTFPRYKTDEITAVLFGCIYPGMMLSFLYLLRGVEEGGYLVWLIFLSSWGSDTCAYCVGMLFKKFLKTHQMTPVLSPKKSVEGGIGGLAGATLLGVIFGAVFAGKLYTFSIPASVACGVLCLCGGIISMIGDLAASAIKRNHDIKDYGHLIPGHGGIMDRFDSIVFCAPVLYFITLALQNI
jgi:phosphatidate cytidylyltransferase